jgi:hypothetical protein
MLADGRSISRPVKHPSRLAAVLLVLIAVMFAAAVPASAATPSDAVIVAAAPANSGDLVNGEALRVQATVTNPNSVTSNLATATLLVGHSPLTSRAALANWFAGRGKTKLATVPVASTGIPSIASGLSTGLQLTAAASTVRFGARGIYPIEVRVTSGADVLGVSRTAVTWGVANTTAVPVVLALPLTVPAVQGEFLTAAELTQYTSADGILTRELADVTNSQIAIGIDPRIIASIRVLGSSVPSSAKAWLDQLAALPNETFPLAWADADLTAPLRAGAKSVLKLKSLQYAINSSLFPANGSTPTPTPTNGESPSPVPTSDSLVAWNYTMPKLGWPAEDSVSTSDLPKLTAAGITSEILTTSNVQGLGSHGLSGASGKSGSSTIAVSDDTLSGYLGSALQASTRTQAQDSMTQLSATLALISLESGTAPRTVLLTLDRNWATDDSDVVHSISTIYERPWVTSAVLSSVFAENPAALKLAKPAESQTHVAMVAQALAAERAVDRFAPVAAAPDAITSATRLQLLSLLSNQWSDAPGAWTTAAKSYVTQSNKVVDSVQVSKSSTYLGLADQLELPVSISNGLDQDVTVNLEVRSTRALVSINPDARFQTVTISADSQKRIQIPMQALSNGNARLVVTLTSATGVRIGKTVDLRVNVQAGWETLGTLIFVALIVALFAFGIVRNIRKRRREQAEETEA